MSSKPITFDRAVRSICGLIGIVIVYLLLKKLSGVLVPFFVAWLIAYLLYPIVCFFQYKCKLRYRFVAIVVTLTLLIAVLTLCGWLFIPPIMEEFGRLKDIIVNFVDSTTTSDEFTDFINKYVTPIFASKEIGDLFTFSDISSFLEERIPQLFSVVTGSLSALMGVLKSLIAVIYLFFILMDYERMSSGFIKFIPEKQRAFASGLIYDVQSGMNNYFRGQSLIALCVGILFSIGFVIIDFPMAIPLGMFIGVLNLVPYLQVVGFIPAIILALVKSYDTGQSFWGIFLAGVIVFLVVQSIQDIILTPRIMGHYMRLNGAIILLSLSVWGVLLGFIGLIIALPLTTLMISYYKRYILKEQTVVPEVIAEEELTGERDLPISE